MSTTAYMVPEAFKKWEHRTSVKVGEYWLSIPNEHAQLLRKGEGADITYAEGERNGKTFYNITAVNGQNTQQQRQSSSGPGGPGSGPGRSGPGSGPGAAKASPGAAKAGYEGAWAGMGPENRARQACLHWLEAKAGIKEWDHGGTEALAVELSIVYHAWLQGCEGRSPQTGGGAHSNSMDGTLDGDGVPDYGDDPGPSSEEDYV